MKYLVRIESVFKGERSVTQDFIFTLEEFESFKKRLRNFKMVCALYPNISEDAYEFISSKFIHSIKVEDSEPYPRYIKSIDYLEISDTTDFKRLY
jgi:Na+-transporting NADH:ubiquinone oxidoreductase subunit NqrF